MWAPTGDAEGLGYFILKAKSPKGCLVVWLFLYCCVVVNCNCLLVFVSAVVVVVCLLVCLID